MQLTTQVVETYSDLEVNDFEILLICLHLVFNVLRIFEEKKRI